MYLACPNRCSVNRFELWNASVYVDAQGSYLEHQAADAPLYRCGQCGSPAIDLGQVPSSMQEEDVATEPEEREYACPSCEALFAAPRAQNPVVCPVCGQTFPVAPPA